MSEYCFDSKSEISEGSAGLFHEAASSSLAGPSKPRVVMVGMHLTKTRGGITTLTNGILRSGLKSEYEFQYIASQAEDYSILRKLLLAVTAYVRFVRTLLLKRPALVYVHVGSNASLYRESLFILLAKLFQKPILTHFHAGDIDHYYPKQPAIGKAVIRIALAQSDRIIVVSRESARELRKLDDSMNISILPNAIDTSIFPDRSIVANRPDKKVRLLFVGAVGKLKGETDLIKALALLKKHGDLELRASFLGYGAESLVSYCRDLDVGDLVEHLGPVSMTERVRYYTQADIFVLPTYAEAMPISLMEAMAAGLPVITTPVGGIPEIIRDGEDGLLFPCGEVEALAEKIAFLAKNRKTRNDLGAKAQAKARLNWDMVGYVNKLSGHIDSTIETGRPKPKLFVKRTIKSVAAATGSGRIRSARLVDSVNILAYHRVVSDIRKAERDAYYGLVVSTETFRRHCELLKAAFDVVPLERAYSNLTGKRPSSRPLAVITFDDGYLDFYENAFPVLRSLGLPGTVFLPTQWIGRDVPLDHDRLYWLLTLAAKQNINVTCALERAGVPAKTVAILAHSTNLPALTELLVYLPIVMRSKVISELEATIPRLEPYPPECKLLNWEQISEMADAGISFGAHTANHVVLTAETQAAAVTEIVASKNDLETRLGRQVFSFAYPNGEFTPSIREAVSAAGFKAAVTTNNHINRPGADLFTLGRFSLCEESTRGITGQYSNGVAAMRLGV